MDRPAAGRARFTAFLALLATALVLLPMIAVGRASRAGIELAVVLAMVSVVWKLMPGRSLLLLSALVASLTEAASMLRIFSPARAWVVLDHAGSIAFLLLVAGLITRNVWRERAVTSDTIVGGIAVYILLGVVWSAAYQLLEFLAPGSFTVASASGGRWGPWEAAPGQYPRLFFFSFVTLTTLGYGDIVPASIPAAILTTVEAVAGPLYLTILIARLVGLHVASAAGKGGAGAAGPGERQDPAPPYS